MIPGNGADIPNQFERYLARHPSSHFPTLIALVDSDRPFPEWSIDPAKTAGKLMETVRRMNIKDPGNRIPRQSLHECVWILQKREVENYIPELGLRNGGADERFLEGWKRLDSAHKDYLDIKGGLKKSLTNANDQTEPAKESDSNSWRWRDCREQAFWNLTQYGHSASDAVAIQQRIFSGKRIDLKKALSSEDLLPMSLAERDGISELDQILDFFLDNL